jgi:DNA (cytosine-5)-methyltransferase 1
MTDPLTHGSLFSGIGGFDLGFDCAGMTTLWQAEKESNCLGVLERHWPTVARLKDVKSVGAETVEQVAVISGGFPCQDISVSGRRQGLAGPRSGLWYQYARVIRELSPVWVVIENVLGLLSSNGGRDLGIILSTLGECGYGFAYRVLDSQHFGVPQRRRRVFIVGHLGSRGRAAEVLLEPDSVPGGPSAWRPTSSDSPTPTEASLGEESQAVIGLEINQSPTIGIERAPALTANGRGTGLAIPDGKGGYTLRRATPIECERMHGFPDNWTASEGLRDDARYRMLGNAVTANVARWIGQRILDNEKLYN